MFVFFKQKTAYEMRISDWSSDVCSSDLPRPARGPRMCQSVRKAATVLAWNADQHSLRRDTALVLTGIRKPLPRRQFHWSEQYSTRSEQRRVGKACGSTGRSGW